ncbi:MAG: hypothetical protein Sapg2KO_22960 [Saprospiraceae bacterium]
MQQALHYIGTLLICATLLGLASTASYTSDPEAYLEIEALYTNEGLLQGYQAYVKTPVCETDNCYIVEINFTWDLIGRFQKYDTIVGAGLTKLDHIPFTEGDYQKLDQLLKDSKSPLANYKKEELVRDTRSSTIDGFTGATVLEVKESVISGGVYSCYTLWHLAHGPVVDSLQRRTYLQLDTALVEKIVDQSDQEMNYFLMQYFSEQNYLQYLPQILKTFESGSGYYAKQAIEQMPKSVFATPLAQDFFAEQFGQLNYFTQVALLKKLQSETLSKAMIQTLQTHLEERNSAKDVLIRALLEI